MASNEELSRPLTYLEQRRDPASGDHALIVRLGSTLGMLIMQRHLDVRQEGVTGTLLDWVPGHGGDVWWVRHDESTDVGAYSIDEMAPLPNENAAQE